MIGSVLVITLVAAMAVPQEDRASDPSAETVPDSAFMGPNVGLGPFRALTVSPFGSLRPGFFAVPPSTLPQGSFELHDTEEWANIWSVNDGKFFLDYEVLVSDVSLAYGIADGLQGQLSFVDGARFGGTLDPLIVGTHRLIGARRNGRPDFPENDFRFEFDAGHGRPEALFSNRDRGSFAQAVLGSLQYTYAGERGGPPALTGSLSFRREVGESDFDGGSPIDVAGSVGTSIGFGNFYAYLGTCVAWYGHERFHGLALRSIQILGIAAIEWNLADPFSLIFRYQIIEGAIDSAGPFSRPTHESTIGFKLEASKGVLFELAMIENHVNPYNSADFGWHAGMTMRW